MSKNSEKSMTDSAAEMLPKIVAFVNHPDEPGFRVIGVRVSEDEFKYFNEGIDWLKSKLSPASPGVRVPVDKWQRLIDVHRGWCNYCQGNEKACLLAPKGGCTLRDCILASPSSQGNGDGGTEDK